MKGVFESNGRRLTETNLEPDDCIENRVFSGHYTMVESDYDLAVEDTDRIHGRTALVNNVRAALSLAGAIRSTLGPKGLDKMLVDADGTALVTNDGVTVLETANVEHPTARMLIDASSSQDRSARDGTTTTVLLISEMLQNALELVRLGVHPSIIVNGYSLALDEAISEISRVSKTLDQSQKFQVIRTSLQGKGDSSLCDILAGFAIEAADSLIDLGDGDDIERMFVKRLQIKEGGVKDSSLERGLMMLKSRVDISTEANADGGRIAIIDGGLDKQKLEVSASIEISSPGTLQDFHRRSRQNLRKQVDHLEALGVDLLIVREGIDDEAVSMLTDSGITAYRRFEREDMDLLSRITGATPIRKAEDLSADDIGSYSNRSEEVVSEVKHTLIEGLGGGMTLVVRGSTPEIRDEAIRIFDDAIGVAHRLNSKPGILPGGGAIQAHLASHLRAFSQTQSGREQLAIEAYASALESIPRILAENAGRDPVEVILSLLADQKDSGAWVGFDLQSGKNCDMEELGILDTEFVVSNALSGATDAAIGVLRIDDVLWARTDPSTPDWESSED